MVWPRASWLKATASRRSGTRSTAAPHLPRPLASQSGRAEIIGGMSQDRSSAPARCRWTVRSAANRPRYPTGGSDDRASDTSIDLTRKNAAERPRKARGTLWEALTVGLRTRTRTLRGGPPSRGRTMIADPFGADAPPADRVARALHGPSACHATQALGQG